MDSEDIFTLGLAVAGLLFIGALGIYGISQARTASACLASGYPTAAVSYTFDRYCIKRVDQTDVVVPFDKR